MRQMTLTEINRAQPSRTAYFDHLRVFASFLIMLLHIAALCWYDADVNSSSWFILNAFKSATDHAVLLFVMISGSLFLGRDIPIKKLYSKYILRIAVAFVAWSFIYALVSNFRWGILSVLQVTLASHYHLWFLPLIAGLYICIPIFRLIVKNDRNIRYFLILAFIFAFLIPQCLTLAADFGGTTISQYAGFIQERLDEMNVHLVCGYAFFFVAGYYINKTDIPKKLRLLSYILAAVGFFITLFMTTFQARHTGTPLDNYHENFNIGVLLTLLGTFIFFKYNVNRESRLIVRLSKYSFGAYLVHALIIEQLASRLGLTAVSFNPVLATLAIGIIVFIVSFAISALLNLIPGIRRYIV